MISQHAVHNLLSFSPLLAPRVAQLWKGNTADMQKIVKALMEYWDGPQLQQGFLSIALVISMTTAQEEQELDTLQVC